MNNKPEAMHPDEWALRVDLAACYRLVALYGWSDLVFTHISAKLPASVTGGEDQFLINPYGLMFDEITASSLVKVDLRGHKLDDSPHPVYPAGFTIHGAIHAPIWGNFNLAWRRCRRTGGGHHARRHQHESTHHLPSAAP